MARVRHARKRSKSPEHEAGVAAGPVKGWKAIADYLGQPVGTIKRWAEEGMPVARAGRYVEAEPQKLSAWLGRESGVRKPVHIAPEGDLSDELREAVREAKRSRKIHRVK